MKNNKCPICKTANRKQHKYCHNCGYKLGMKTYEEIEKIITEADIDAIGTISTLDILLRKLFTLEEDEDYRVICQLAIVKAIESLIPLVDEEYQKENEGFMRVLTTDRTRLLRMYRNRQE